MKIEIIKNTVAGKKSVHVGDVIDVEAQEAHFLIHRRKAKLYEAPAIAAVEQTPETETPAPRRRGRQKHEE